MKDVGIIESKGMVEAKVAHVRYFLVQVRQKVLQSRGALVSVVSRGFEIIFRMGVYWGNLSYDCLVGRGEEMVPLRAAQLRTLLCELGPSFVKAGQVLNNLLKHLRNIRKGGLLF